MKVEIKSDKRKWDALRKRIDDARKFTAQVGVLASKGGAVRHTRGQLTLVELAAIHEFGSPAAGIPERSFIRSTFRDPNKTRQITERLAKAVVHGQIEPRTALEHLGQWGAAQVKNTITQSDIPPPLQTATIERKGSTKPLVDTGQLLGAITYEVVER